MTVTSQHALISDGATESDLKDLLNELEIMATVGHHPNLVNLIGACSSEGESALNLELKIAEVTISRPLIGTDYNSWSTFLTTGFWGGEMDALPERGRIGIRRGEV